jgi:hypothetical protein
MRGDAAMNIDDCTSLFREAFEPLRGRLNQQAERIRQGEDPHNQFSPWLICAGKGGSQRPEYLQYPDISLYRHCMDVATVAFMLFTHAWQANRLPGLTPEDEAGAQKALQILLAIAFLHDADKYRDQTDAWDKSQSPELAHVEKLYDLLEVGHWTGLSVQDCFALVSRVETGRGKKNALFTPPPPDPMTDMLAAMVAEGDKLTSIASRPENTVAQGRSGHKNGNRSVTMRRMLRRLVDVYNDEKRLKAWIAQYNVPDERLRLLEFRQSPVVLYHLRAVCLEHLDYKERFPLVCLLDGEHLSITVPEWFDVAEVLESLQGQLAFNERDERIKRNHTNGELSLLHIHDVTTLIRVATDDAYEPRVLTVHIDDWDAVIDYIRSWVGAVGGLVIRDQSATGKLLLPVAVHDTADLELPERYAYALAIACTLRSGAKGKLFEERLLRLRNWQDGRVERGLQCALSDVALDRLDKNTQQAIYAMQAAMEIHDSAVLHALVEQLHGSFPPRQADVGTEVIIRSLKSQCGLSTDNDEPDELVYASAPQGGTCLLTGAPATQPIKTNSMTLAGVKTSAFNNRIGHRKSLWSQTEKNYLSEAALKQQALLVDTMASAGKPATGQPLLVAMPLRSILKPIQEVVDSGEHVVNMYMANNEKDAGWKQVWPWNLDVSEAMPLMLETVDGDFDSQLHTMYRMAMLALYSGDPVHVFIAAQRDIAAAFAFEQTPPLLQTLLRDLTMPDDAPGTVRRDRLPDLVQRLGLFRQIITTNYGHDVLLTLPGYGWWAVAWLQARLLQDEKPFAVSAIPLARKAYPMKQDNQLERIAELATHVQRNPGRRASHSERTFAFTTVLEPFTTGKQYGQSETVIIAAMAETLVNALDRREMYARGEGSLAERCQAFAREVYDFMTNNFDQGRFDARFQRFSLAAYANLFMAKHTISSSQEAA